MSKIDEAAVPEWNGQNWPWRELEALAAQLAEALATGVAQIMQDAGETGPELAQILRRQVAYFLQARIGKEHTP